MGEADIGSSLPLSSQLELEQSELVELGAQLLAVVSRLSFSSDSCKSVSGRGGALCVCPHPSVSMYFSRKKEDGEDRAYQVTYY